MTTSTSAPHRALVLAGGGLKVAFQAGVLQVWLDEMRTSAGDRVTFDIADGASGGVFNLAMWCQGLTGKQIADQWRATKPLRGLSPNITRWAPHFDSLLTYDRFRRRVLRQSWRLDWSQIRGTSRGDAGFNLFNVTKQQPEVLNAENMDEDALISAVSLPLWFRRVERDGDAYIDAVFATDANIEHVIEQGATEVWIIWTVSQRGRWRPGLVNEYFQVIEAAANSNVRAILKRIECNNQQQSTYEHYLQQRQENREELLGADQDVAPQPGEFGRTICVRWLSAEVPLHYLFNFTRGGFQDAVDRGMFAARAWVEAQPDLELRPPTSQVPSSHDIRFKEFFVGEFTYTSDPNGLETGGTEALRLNLRAKIPNVNAFMNDVARLVDVDGVVVCDSLGGDCDIRHGSLQWFVDEGDPRCKQLVYRLQFLQNHKDQITLIGRKFVVHDKDWDLWQDTTDLHCKLYRGWINDDDPNELFGVGFAQISFPHFIRSLASFRSNGGVVALLQFLTVFIRQLWQVYHGPVIPQAADGRPEAPTQPPALGRCGQPVPTNPPMPWS